ncbi:MAG: PaaI family thioesterase [Chloroflexia bacterium]
MKSKDPNYKSAVKNLLEQTGQKYGLDLQLLEVGPGWCRAGFAFAPGCVPEGLQISTGLQMLLAECTAAAAATTLIGEDEATRTVEFRASLLRPAEGAQLICTSRVLTPGSTLVVAGSEIFTPQEERLNLVAKSMVTLSITGK